MMPKTNENDYLNKALQGDEVSFLYLYDLWVDKVYAFCYLQTRDHDSAEDICLNVFRNAWSGLGEYRADAGSFCTWLFSIARAELVMQSTARRQRTAPATRPRLSPRQDTSRFDPMIGKLAELPALCREVLILKLVTGFSSPEICQTLKISPQEMMRIQAQGLSRMSGRPTEEQSIDPREGAYSKLDYLRSRIDVLQAQSYELDDAAFDRHAVQLANLEARWEDLTERSRRLEGAPLTRWAELNVALDDVLVDVGQEASHRIDIRRQVSV
jgi:RNA polymerase sigma factor (sigma-70 family)